MEIEGCNVEQKRIKNFGPAPKMHSTWAQHKLNISKLRLKMTQRELKMNKKCTKMTRKGIWCQCDSLWHRDYVHVSQIMIMWLIIPLICSWVNDRRSVISNSKKSFKNNPLLDSLENGGLMETRALVPSLFDVPFLWCSISKKIEMTWTRKFRVENSFFFVFTILDDPYQIMFIDPEFWF